jgi:hypothetical protein
MGINFCALDNKGHPKCRNSNYTSRSYDEDLSKGTYFSIYYLLCKFFIRSSHFNCLAKTIYWVIPLQRELVERLLDSTQNMLYQRALNRIEKLMEKHKSMIFQCIHLLMGLLCLN